MPCGKLGKILRKYIEPHTHIHVLTTSFKLNTRLQKNKLRTSSDWGLFSMGTKLQQNIQVLKYLRCIRYFYLNLTQNLPEPVKKPRSVINTPQSIQA